MAQKKVEKALKKNKRGHFKKYCAFDKMSVSDSK